MKKHEARKHVPRLQDAITNLRDKKSRDHRGEQEAVKHDKTNSRRRAVHYKKLLEPSPHIW
ncbi:hypothetical protein E2C01_074434 [Portunus trituberculatus]|uniref:Uncharacterized protein n=1 Tax=Portunus trituberculatus TaxID=210409 RepID=A0A5B7I3C5_PORTR|nr:hypothetical protein [Portunus trituberculatus]